MRQRPWRLLPSLIFIALLCGLGPAGIAQPVLETEVERTLFIGALNFDSIPDTVRGAQRPGARGYLPHTILWGQPNTDGPALGQMRQTRIVYPETIRDGSTAFHSINGDSLSDIVLYLHETVQQGDEETETLHALAIFGQQGLDSLPMLEIGQIGRFQANPFFAMELSVGSELTQAGTRDLSGAMSYVLEPVELTVDESRPSPLPASTSATSTPHLAVQVYPNPTANTIQIEAAGLPAGAYDLSLIAVNGTTALHEDLSLVSGERLHRTLDVRNIPSGTYIVRIENDAGKSFATMPLSITR